MSSSFHLSQKHNSLIASIIDEGKEVVVVDLRSKKQLHKLSIPKSDIDSKFTSVAFSHKDTFFVAATSAGDLHILTIKPGKVDIKKKTHSAAVNCVVFSKTKDIVYSAGSDGIVKSYDFTSQKFETLINFKGLNKKDSIGKTLGKNSIPLSVDVNGRNTLLLLAVKAKILLYSLTESKFIRSFEDHKNPLKLAKFMDYSQEQRKDINSIETEYFMSLAEGEDICNIWKISNSDKSSSKPFKVLELTNDKVLGIQLKQIAEHYYFAIFITSNYVCGYILNLKSKDVDQRRKFDFKVTLDEESINGNNCIASAYIKNEYELTVLSSNGESIDSHYITYLNDEGKSMGTDITIKCKQKQIKSSDFDSTNVQHHNISKGVLEGFDISTLHLKVDKLFKGDKTTENESIISVLEQGLQENNVDAINFVVSITDLDTIYNTVSRLTKDSLHQLMFNLLLNLQQKTHKGALLWLSSVLKSRWIDVLNQVNKSSIHTKQTLVPMYSHLKSKTANMPKYFEAQAKIQMVLESRKQTDNMEAEDEKHAEVLPEDSHKANQNLNNEENIDEVVEDIEQNDYGNNIEEGEDDDENHEGDSEDSDKYRAELDQYGDDFHEEGEDDASMDDDDDLED